MSSVGKLSQVYPADPNFRAQNLQLPAARVSTAFQHHHQIQPPNNINFSPNPNRNNFNPFATMGNCCTCVANDQVKAVEKFGKFQDM
jgi:hypothetical protein